METLKIAIPNKGRLSENIIDLLNRAGLKVSQKAERSLISTTNNGLYEIIFLRTQDIPKFVEAGIADIGFSGHDIVCEEKSNVDELMPLKFGKCIMVVAVKEEDNIISVKDMKNGMRIATSFPNIAKDYFKQNGKEIEVIEVNGATEITPRLGLCDAVVDITSTGSTLKANKLKIIDEILTSSAVIVGQKDLQDRKPQAIKAFLRAIKAAVDAEGKKYLMTNLPKKSLDKIKDFLPGLTSPTVTTLLGNEDEVAVHAVLGEDEVYNVVDKLKELGATGIVIMNTDQVIP